MAEALLKEDAANPAPDGMDDLTDKVVPIFGMFGVAVSSLGEQAFHALSGGSRVLGTALWQARGRVNGMRGSWRAVALYPPSWMAMAAVLVAVGAILIVLEPSPVLSVVVIIVGILAVIAWPVTLSATGTLAEISAPSDEPSTVSEVEVLALADRLDRLDGRRPSDQLRDIRRSYDRIEFLLDRRRAAGDPVYERYRSDAERLYLAVIARLHMVLADATDTDAAAGTVSEPATGTNMQPTEDLAGHADVAHDARVTNGPEDGSESTSADDSLAQNDVVIAAMERASRELGRVQVGQSTRDAADALEAIRALAGSQSEW